MSHCSKTVPQPKIPEGVSVETALTHPLWKWYLRPGAPCVLDGGHDGPHRAQPEGEGGLVWHDPALLLVGGRAEDSQEPEKTAGQVAEYGWIDELPPGF